MNDWAFIKLLLQSCPELPESGAERDLLVANVECNLSVLAEEGSKVVDGLLDPWLLQRLVSLLVNVTSEEKGIEESLMCSTLRSEA